LKPQGLRVGVIGAGSFGTALAILLAENGCEVHLWGRSDEIISSLSNDRENAVYLPGLTVPPNVYPTTSLETACAGSKVIVGVTPSHVIREIFGRARVHIDKDSFIVCASKGIEQETLDTVDQILCETLPEIDPERVMVLSGPSFAKELAQKIPTAVSLAGPNEHYAKEIQEVFMRPFFRVYTSPDVVGVALGGSIKNVMAIAVGMADGLGLGHNTRAGLLTRGLRELTRLAVSRGAHPLTLSGLSGLGDLVLTCTGDLSRNRSLGIDLGRGQSLQEILSKTRMVAEGVRTAASVVQLARQNDVDAPICWEVYRVLYEGKDPKQGAHDLMNRPPRSEHEFAPDSDPDQ